MAVEPADRDPGPDPDGASPDDATREHVVAGNRLRLLVAGPDRLAALLALIDEARHSLRLLYYIFATDASATQVRDALARAARRGVAVTLIVDSFGSTADDAFFATLRQAGASVRRFEPRWGRRYLLRNHQKLAIADEAVAMIGGFNVEDDYFADGKGAWRDLGLRIQGPAAARIVRYFDALDAWICAVRPTIRSLRRTLAAGSETQGAVRWLVGGPTRALSPWAQDIRKEMERARRLAIVAAYFAPNPAMLRRIEGVARRGGDARVVTAAKSDNRLTIMAARHTYARLLRRGVRVLEYQRSKLHTKLFVVDDAVHIGSANFDIRSLYINCELMLRIEDAGFAAALRGYIDGEIAGSKEITQAAHRASGVLDRVRWTIAYFLVSIVDGNLSRRLNFGFDGR